MTPIQNCYKEGARRLDPGSLTAKAFSRVLHVNACDVQVASYTVTRKATQIAGNQLEVDSFVKFGRMIEVERRPIYVCGHRDRGRVCEHMRQLTKGPVS